MIRCGEAAQRNSGGADWNGPENKKLGTVIVAGLGAREKNWGGGAPDSKGANWCKMVQMGGLPGQGSDRERRKKVKGLCTDAWHLADAGKA